MGKNVVHQSKSTKKNTVKRKMKKEIYDDSSGEDMCLTERDAKKVKKMKIAQTHHTDDSDTVALYIANINPNASEEDLRRFIGAIVVDLPHNKKDNTNKGFGFAVIEASRQKSVLKKNGIKFQGRPLKIEVSRSKPPLKKTNRLHIKNLPVGTTVLQLEKIFGKNVDITVVRRGSKGMWDGFLGFNCIQAAQRAVTKYQGHELGENHIKLVYTGEVKQNKQGKVLKISKLSPKSTAKSIKKMFTTVASVHMPMDVRTRKHKGFAYLVFNTVEDALEAKKEMNGEVIEGSSIHLHFATIPKRGYAKKRQLEKLAKENQTGYEPGDTSDEEGLSDTDNGDVIEDMNVDSDDEELSYNEESSNEDDTDGEDYSYI